MAGRYYEDLYLILALDDHNRFIQRDFVMENLHLTSLEAINEGFQGWIGDYNFNHSYSVSARRLFHLTLPSWSLVIIQYFRGLLGKM